MHFIWEIVNIKIMKYCHHKTVRSPSRKKNALQDDPRTILQGHY